MAPPPPIPPVDPRYKGAVAIPALIAANAKWIGNDWDPNIATAVALAESDGRLDATHKNGDGTTDYGLYQINSVHADVIAAHGGLWYSPIFNTQMAHDIWRSAGGSFSPWSTYKSGAYKSHMDIAKQAVQNSDAVATDIGNKDGSQTKYDNPIANLANGVIGVAQSIFKGAAWMAKPHNWGRVAVTMVGGALIIGGLVVMSGSSLAKAVNGVADAVPVPKPKGGGAGGRATSTG